jgi:hypothetical protein
MTHKVGVVRHEGSVHLWALDLPGCIVGGRDVAETAVCGAFTRGRVRGYILAIVGEVDGDVGER